MSSTPSTPSTGTPTGGWGPLPIQADRTAPKLTVSAKKVQRALKARRLVLKARCNERCKLLVRGKLRVGKRTVSLGRARVTAVSGKTVATRIKLSRKALARLRKATASGRAKVVLSVRAADAAGNRTAATRRVSVKR